MSMATQHLHKNILISILALLSVGLLISCDDSHRPKSRSTDFSDEAAPTVDENENNSVNEKPAPSPEVETSESALPEIPQQPAITNFESNVLATLIENSQQPGEAISVDLEQHGRWLSRHLYTFKKSYLGTKDNSTFLGFGTEDDVSWDTPWKIISANLKNFRVYGGDDVGKGTPIGYIQWDGREMKLVLQTEFRVDKVLRKVTVLPPLGLPKISTEDCPWAVTEAGMCVAYVHIYNALSSIDYKAFGQSGPYIAKEVLSFNTAFRLTRSVWSFEPEVDQIRKFYLVPLLKLMKQLNALNTIDKNSASYISQTQKVYTNLVVTSVDTILKTQKIMPEMTYNLGQTSFGVLLAYIGMQKTGDKVIGRGQPKWFTEIVSPIIREFGIISIDILLNGSKTPLADRIHRLTEMEAQVQAAVIKICKESSVSRNECLVAIE
jgi:hypothetical protein